MPKRVTVGLPVYKRLNYLPSALESVSAQDYPNIELIVSDNGMNGSRVPEITDAHCSIPYRFRQNSESVSIAEHFNQLVHAASGEYFVLLCDDDEISPSYISELVRLLEDNPDASAAFGRIEVMDESGKTVTSSDAKPLPPALMSGEDFIRAWCRHEHKFVCFVTNMARTREIRECGGYPDFPSGNGIDNALLVKLCLGRSVAFSQECTFRYRVYESSYGLAASYHDLAQASREFLDFLDTDPNVLKFARKEPATWAHLKRELTRMTWRTCFSRWKRMYRRRLSNLEWIRAAFAMPFIPAYYRAVGATLLRSARQLVRRRVQA